MEKTLVIKSLKKNLKDFSFVNDKFIFLGFNRDEVLK